MAVASRDKETPPASHLLSPEFGRMPVELKGQSRWVVWKGAKVPYCATAANSKASATDPDTWAGFDQAQTAYEEGGYTGVGFVLNGDGIVGVDLDKCVADGTPAPAALAILHRIGCRYIELSPSGTGLRGFGYASPIKGKRGTVDGVNVELYASQRYLTVTGRSILSGPLVPLKGFGDVANIISPSHLQRKTEDDRSHLLLSSVGTDSLPDHTLPKEVGQRNARLFELARWIKGVNPDATHEELRKLALLWHEAALPVIGTKDFAITWADFMHGLKSVKQPYGQTMTFIMNSIDLDTPLPAAVKALGYGPHGEHLVHVCFALGKHHYPEPFFIAARQAGDILGVHFTDASKMLTSLVADEVLQLVSKGVGNKASRYRVNPAIQSAA